MNAFLKPEIAALHTAMVQARAEAKKAADKATWLDCTRSIFAQSALMVSCDRDREYKAASDAYMAAIQPLGFVERVLASQTEAELIAAGWDVEKLYAEMAKEAA